MLANTLFFLLACLQAHLIFSVGILEKSPFFLCWYARHTLIDRRAANGSDTFVLFIVFLENTILVVQHSPLPDVVDAVGALTF